MSLKVLLVDDEEPARRRLRKLLGAFPQLEVVGEAEDGEQALESVDRLKPDLLFLDIQMPGCSGLEVAAALPRPRPRVIFCTAYDQYAVEAFELHAVDYLLKPVNRGRLAQAVERVLATPTPDQDRALDQLSRAPEGGPRRFLGKRAGRFCVIPASEVLCFQSEGGLTKICTAKVHYWTDPSLNDLEARLSPAAYYRVSRSALVRLEAVREVLPMPGGSGKVVLSDGSELDVSRRRLKGLLEKLGS